MKTKNHLHTKGIGKFERIFSLIPKFSRINWVVSLCMEMILCFHLCLLCSCISPQLYDEDQQFVIMQFSKCRQRKGFNNLTTGPYRMSAKYWIYNRQHTNTKHWKNKCLNCWSSSSYILNLNYISELKKDTKGIISSW
jgi:hypothetical protein